MCKLFPPPFYGRLYAALVTKLQTDIVTIALVSYVTNEVLSGLGGGATCQLRATIPGIYMLMAERLAMTSLVQRLWTESCQEHKLEQAFQVSCSPKAVA